MPNLNNPRLAQLVNAEGRIDLKTKQSYETFATHAEAEVKAKAVANAAHEDAVILQNEDGFQVVGIDELHALLPGSRFDGELVREAPIVSFVMTDPTSGQENIIGRQASLVESAATPARPPTALDRYAERFQAEVGTILGEKQQATLSELNPLIYALQDNGIDVSVELNKDIFERQDSFNGLKQMLTYALDNREPLQQRSIRAIAIVNEWDDIGGTRVDLDYDKKESQRRLVVGDDFLDDWGGGLVDKSVAKITDELGASLSEAEVIQRSESFRTIRGGLSKSFDALNRFQQQNMATPGAADAGPLIAELESTLDALVNETLPAAERQFKTFSIQQERQASQDYLKVLKDTISEGKHQLVSLKAHQSNDALELNGRLEKLKIVLLKGAEATPDSRNHIGGYVSGLGHSRQGTLPSTGLEYTRALGAERSTTASLRAGSTSALSSKGVSTSDIMLGLGVSHTVDSPHAALDGMTVGVGVGYSRETPFFIGASASNSWYLNDYHGLSDQGSVVGHLHASVGTYSNVGGSIQVHKQLTQNIDFEGSGELSLWNQSLEAEAELTLNKDKSVYLTGGVGTHKLVYAGVGFADQYELEVGLGGASLGKDSNHLPGESGWELGLRIVPLPLPYYRHHRVPGYQFTYADKSTQYITPNGSFMTVKENAAGEKQRIAYVPDPASTERPNSIVYRRIQQQSELEHLDDAPQRELTFGPLGYLTVTEDGKTLVDDGLIQQPMTAAELGILTDQSGVLWFDRMRPASDHKSLGARREELPLPLYRAVHR